MTPICSISSQLTTKLITFRNPKGEEKNWIRWNFPLSDQKFALIKPCLFVVEVGIPFLLVTAVIETLVLSILLSLSFLFQNTSLRLFSSPRLSSSFFTIFWNFRNLTTNFYRINIPTHESLSRLVLKFLRDEDTNYIKSWANECHLFDLKEVNNPLSRDALHPFLKHVVNHVEPLVKKEGCEFFKNKLLQGLDDETINALVEADADAMHFGMFRTVYLYSLGSEREKPFPPFVSSETQQYIQTIRNDYEPTNVLNCEDVLNKHTFLSEAAERLSCSERVFKSLKEHSFKMTKPSHEPFFMGCWMTAAGEVFQAKKNIPE